MKPLKQHHVSALEFHTGAEFTPKYAFKVGCEGEANWRRVKADKPVYTCALCYRRIAVGEHCYRAQYRAAKGVYLQAYHPSCAYIAQTNARAIRALKSPGETLQWARENTCLNCKQWGRCRRNPFDCEQAVLTLRLYGKDANK